MKFTITQTDNHNWEKNVATNKYHNLRKMGLKFQRPYLNEDFT